MLTSVKTHDSEHKLISRRISQKVVFVVYFILWHHGGRNCQKTKLSILFPLSVDEGMISENQLPYASVY